MEPDVIIAMDGNFQHRHQTYASKDLPQEDNYPSSFLLPSQIKIHASNFHQTDQQAKGVKVSTFFNQYHEKKTLTTDLHKRTQNACSDSHTAANDVRNSSSWDWCDDTGLFACACRHDVPLKFANLYQTGEK